MSNQDANGKILKLKPAEQKCYVEWCQPEDILFWAKILFHPDNHNPCFDYQDGAPGYRMDGDKLVWPLEKYYWRWPLDDRPDVNCGGLVNTSVLLVEDLLEEECPEGLKKIPVEFDDVREGDVFDITVEQHGGGVFHKGFVTGAKAQIGGGTATQGWSLSIFHCHEPGVGPTDDKLVFYDDGQGEGNEAGDGKPDHAKVNGEGMDFQTLQFYRYCCPKKVPVPCPPPPGPGGGGGGGGSATKHNSPTPPPRRDPLLADLDGNGIQTVGLEAGVYCDHDGNGFMEITSWAAQGTGVVFLDMDGNDRPDSGAELLGDSTLLPDGRLAANGFEVLAQYDTNDDGMIDASDPIWSQLRMWQWEEDTSTGDGCDSPPPGGG